MENADEEACLRPVNPAQVSAPLGIEVGHGRNEEMFNRSGNHAHSLHGHDNFHALVLPDPQVVEGVLHLWGFDQGEAEVKVATLVLRVRLAAMRQAAMQCHRSARTVDHPWQPAARVRQQ